MKTLLLLSTIGLLAVLLLAGCASMQANEVRMLFNQHVGRMPDTNQEKADNLACYQSTFGSSSQFWWLKSGLITGPIYTSKYRDCLAAHGYTLAQ